MDRQIGILVANAVPIYEYVANTFSVKNGGSQCCIAT